MKFLLPILAIVAVLFLGFRPEWNHHLVGDVKYYYSLTNYFWSHQTIVGYPNPIAYQPGGNLFFLLLSLGRFIDTSFEVYLGLLIGANLLMFLILSRFSSPRVLALLILGFGPLVFFRFDLLAAFLTSLSILAFSRKRFVWAAVLLGLGTATKVFPVILLPYFLLFAKPKVKMVLAFGLSGLLLTAFYMSLTHDTLPGIMAAIDYNFSKSVHIESVWGTVLTIINMVKNPGLHAIDFKNGLFILTPAYLLGHLRLFRFLGLGGLGLVYGLIILRNWRAKAPVFRISTCLLILFTLLVTSQVISPQYLIWSFFLIPILPAAQLSTRFWKINLGLIFLALLLTQYVYPLNYDTFIFDFYGQGRNVQFFWAIALRNLILVILTWRLLKNEGLWPLSWRKRG